MVAPYDIGDPARSFVRIPGSGSDPSLKSVCCDLSRGATIAASSTQQNIPQLPPSNNSTATAEKNKCLNVGKGKKNVGSNNSSSQVTSVEQHAQVTSNDSGSTMTNISEGTRSDQMTDRKLPLFKAKNKIVKRGKFPQTQMILPRKAIKMKTGITSSQVLPPRTRFTIATSKKTIIRQPPNLNEVVPNSQHSRGIPELEQGGKIKQQKRIQQHQLFQEIFKDRKRLTALLKSLNVIH